MNNFKKETSSVNALHAKQKYGYFLNEEYLFFSPTNNGSGVGTITHKYSDGFNGLKLSRGIMMWRCGAGMLFDGVKITIEEITIGLKNRGNFFIRLRHYNCFGQYEDVMLYNGRSKSTILVIKPFTLNARTQLLYLVKPNYHYTIELLPKFI